MCAEEVCTRDWRAIICLNTQGFYGISVSVYDSFCHQPQWFQKPTTRYIKTLELRLRRKPTMTHLPCSVPGVERIPSESDGRHNSVNALVFAIPAPSPICSNVADFIDLSLLNHLYKLF